MRLGGNDPPPRNVAGGGLPPELRAVAAGMGPIFCIAAVIALAVVGFISFKTVEITEYGLNYSLVGRKAENRTYRSGLYMIGPVSYFVKFPSTVTTIQFSEKSMQSDLTSAEQGEDELRSRTRDGLDVLIEISFQYQLMPEKLYDLYTTLGPYPNYHNTFVRVAIDRLTESATKFSATEFFNDRTLIGKEMEALLKRDFAAFLYSNIFSFQLRSVGLPPPFEDAIQETEVQKQDLEVAEAEQKSQKVSMETQLMQATRRVKVIDNQAEAQAKTLLLNNDADITQYLAAQQWGADSYKAISADLGSNETALLAYMQARVLRDHPSDKSVIGLSLASPVTKGV